MEIIENGKETTFWPGCFYHNLARLPKDSFVPDQDRTMIMQGIGDHCSQGQLLLFNTSTLKAIVIDNRSFRLEEELRCRLD